MPKKIIKANIIVSSVDGLSDKIVATTGTTGTGADDGLRIPFRYAFSADSIANYAALVASGYFRNPAPIGPDGVTGGGGKYGYILPRTEKLMLVVTKAVTGEETFVISGSARHGIDAKTVTIPSGAVGDQYTYSLYDFGLHIHDTDGEIQIVPGATTTKFALLVRD